MKQLSFATLAYENKKKLTKREKFLNEMEAAVPWDRLLKVREPYYPKAGKGTNRCHWKRCYASIFYSNGMVYPIRRQKSLCTI